MLIRTLVIGLYFLFGFGYAGSGVAVFVVKTVCVIIFASLISSHLCFCAERPQLPEWKKRRSALNRKYVVDEFRIYYTLGGEDALPHVADLNRNSIPDRIENIAIQLTTARTLYTDVLKLRHPLESPRYKDKAKFIDIHVGKLPFTPGGAKNNGSAGDAVVNYFRPDDPDAGIDVLTVDILNTLTAQNLTPAHELFHLFQNGYTMFKASWYTEGTARWVEFSLREGSGEPAGVPLTQADQEKLFSMKYKAARFWITLAYVSDPVGKLKIPANLKRIKYIATKEPVIRDTQFRGAVLLKQLLEALDAIDDQATIDLKLEPFAWKEAVQRSPANNRYIWSVIIDLSRKYAPHSDAVQSMIRNLEP